MTSNNLVYQIRVTLQDSKPPIWRQLLILDSTTLYELHQIIQIAMGWTNSHLHRFIIENKYYGIPTPEDWGKIFDEHHYRLNRFASSEKYKFIYEYDFGDNWGHEILVEKILPLSPEIKYPICIKGERACPPEDVGGICGYENFLDAMNDPEHEEHDSYIEWWGIEFDSEEFYIDDVNETLRQLKKFYFG